ncbi:hypothetical protein LTR28_010603 [Elasticomyces elasticus]|nr:hypothetical protein LTR28_010603 [Elasticomyces elasticus]
MSDEPESSAPSAPSRDDKTTRPVNALQSDFTETQSLDSDEQYLQNALGYKQTLHRQWKFFESFAASFGMCPLEKVSYVDRLTAIAALYFIGGIRVTFSIGVGAGGPAAYW